MKKIKKIFFAVVLAAFVCAFAIPSAWAGGGGEEERQEVQSWTNTTLYNQYFSAVYTGVQKERSAFLTKRSVFSPNDQFCTYMLLKKDIPAGAFAYAIENAQTKQLTVQKTKFNLKIGRGSNLWASYYYQFKLTNGKYNYKIYINDQLVITLPFEVTAQGAASAAANQTNARIMSQNYNRYFNNFYVGKLPLNANAKTSYVARTNYFNSSQDQFCVYMNLKAKIPANVYRDNIYSVAAKRDLQSSFIMVDLKAGSQTSCTTLKSGGTPYPKGEYVYRGYINDTMVVESQFWIP